MQYLLFLIFSLHPVIFFSFTFLAELCLRTTKFVLFVLVLGFYISVTLTCDFCLWFEFSTLTYICYVCVVVSIHYLLYHCIFQFKTAKEMYSFLLAILHTLQSL